MSEPFVFDPRHSLCKTPFGAVPCGGSVTFHCRPLASDHFDHCAVVLLGEFSGSEAHLELSCEGPEGERVRFSGVVTAPSEADLIWYHFRFWGMTAPAASWTPPATAPTVWWSPGS